MKSKKFCIFIIFFLFFNHAWSAQSKEDAQLIQAILKQVNEYRAKNRLQPLKLHSLMSQEATAHSLAMAQKKRPFGHAQFTSRIYRCFKAVGSQNARGAENVAYGYKTAHSVVKGWIASPSHKVNLRGRYTHTGIGIARDKKGRIYYTQLFLRA